ncbi:MAG: hypothetical protein V3T72_17260, partial [Thermoanaerobaculia bacterium]
LGRNRGTLRRMRFDYREAALRHWQDAKYLGAGKRPANADQLYGLAAECALKYAMVVALGAPMTPAGDLIDRSHRRHIDELWSEYQTSVAGRRGSRFLSPLSRFADNPFKDWSIARRYAADSETPGGAILDRHCKASRACLVVLERAGEV